MKTTKMDFVMQDVKFQEVDGRWIPMEALMRYRFEKTDGLVRESEVRHRRLSVDLRPDFEKTGSFKIDLPNGTTIFLPNESPGLRYEWVDGRIVPDFNKEVAAAADRQVRDLREGSSAPKDKSDEEVKASRSQPGGPLASEQAGLSATGTSQQAKQPTAASRLTLPSIHRVLGIAIALSVCGFVLGGVLLVFSYRSSKR
jgi:hypothetical protein